MTYDVDFFIRKFEAIPEEVWTSGDFSAGGKHCSLGHCGAGVNYGTQPIEAVCLSEIFDSAFGKPETKFGVDLSWHVVNINDGQYNMGELYKKYRRPTPKQRILAALKDIKAMQNKVDAVQECDATVVAKSNEAGYQNFSPIKFEKIKELIPLLSNS